MNGECIMGRHNIKSLRYVAIGMIIINIVINILYIINIYGYDIYFLGNINFYSIIYFTGIYLIAEVLVIIFNEGNKKGKKLNEDEKFELKSKVIPLLYLNIFFIGYCLITLLVFKIKILFISAIIMEFQYIAIIIYSKRLYESIITDHKLKWQKKMLGQEDDGKDSNILWRLKIWFYPIEKLPFNQRKIKGVSMFFIIAYVYAWYILSFKNIAIWILTLILFKQIISFIEYVLGLYTYLIGICTSIEYYSGDSKQRRHWTIYVTDYVNKREIVYKLYDKPYFAENDKLKVIHGIFSKNEIKTNVIREKYL